MIPLLDLSVAGALRSGVQSQHWPDGSFSADFTRNGLGSSGFTATGFEVTGAAGIKKLLNQGDARPAVEVRCHQTAWAETYIAEPGSSTVRCSPPAGMARGRLWLWPGIVAVADALMPTDGLHPLLKTDHAGNPLPGIPVKKGHWLAIGRPHEGRLNRDGEYMVVFKFREHVKHGEATIQKVNDTGDAKFHVTLSREQRGRADRDEMLHWAAQAVAFAMLPQQTEYTIEHENGEATVPGSRMGQQLADRLTAAGIPLWDSKTDWDPLRALTAAAGDEAPLLALPDMPDPANGNRT